MKKLLLKISLALLVLLVAGVVALTLSLDRAIKTGVETFGPQVAQVSVKLESVSLSLFSGAGTVRGLLVGNPEGYKTPEAMSLGEARVVVSPGSLLADKIMVKSIRVQAPKVTFELGPGGNNLQRIQANLEATTGGAESKSTSGTPAPATTAGSKKLQVDEVVITGGTVTLGAALLGGKVIEAPLPEIRLNNLGTGPEGITATELGRVILSQINQGALKTYTDKLATAGAEALHNLSQSATNAVNKATSDVLNKATKGLDGLLNKK